MVVPFSNNLPFFPIFARVFPFLSLLPNNIQFYLQIFQSMERDRWQNSVNKDIFKVNCIRICGLMLDNMYIC
jgi:hypothetical protein